MNTFLKQIYSNNIENKSIVITVYRKNPFINNEQFLTLPNMSVLGQRKEGQKKSFFYRHRERKIMFVCLTKSIQVHFLESVSGSNSEIVGRIESLPLID